MFPDDVRVTALWCDAQSLAQQEAKARRVKHRAAADDTMMGQST